MYTNREPPASAVNEIAGSLSSAFEKLEYSNTKVSKASEHSDEMARMANSVTDSIIEVDQAMSSIIKTSETLKKLAEDSAATSRQFRTV